MLVNANLTIEGERCVLVPYRPEHVPQYHRWMTDPALLEATASEPLTLEEEHENCISWREDEGKCTFIVLVRAVPDTPGTGTHGGGMVGDVNFFLNDHDDPHAAEIEIMVAEQGARRKGIASEALRLMMAFAIFKVGVRLFRAKIGEDNQASLELFAKLGYQRVSYSSVFKEVTLEWVPPADTIASAGAKLVFGVYDREADG